MLATGLYYVGSKFGRSFTRTICANKDRTIEQKHEALRKASWFLWPGLVVPALLGSLCAQALGSV